MRLAAAMAAAMRELAPTVEPAVRLVYLGDAAAAADGLAAITAITGSGSIRLPRIKISGQLTVEDRRRWLAGLSDG